MASTSYNPTAKADGGGEATSEAPAAVLVPMPHKESDELYRGLKKAKKDRGSTAKERISKMPPCTAGKRSSIYRGVTRHRWTGRYEAHLWDKSTWNQNQNKKGKQVYLGAYDDEEAAARAYDLAALRYWGPGTLINFPVTDYKRDLEEMQNMSREEYLALLRRKSSGFSRGTSKYRPLTSSRWDPYFGRASGTDYNKSISYGDNNATAEKDYIGSLCVDRKIDLTNYIKWWGTTTTTTTTTTTNKQQGQVDSHNKSLHDEDLGSESKAMTLSNYPTEPYEMPRLGMSTVEGKKQKGGSSTSALSILLRSAAYKRLQEKGLKRKAIEENDDNENRNAVNDRMDRGKGVVEKSSHQVQMKDLDLGMMEDYSFKQMLFFHPFPPSSFDGAF